MSFAQLHFLKKEKEKENKQTKMVQNFEERRRGNPPRKYNYQPIEEKTNL